MSGACGRFNLTKPCKNCPFRTDVQPYITYERAAEIAEALVRQQATFACHKTTVESDDGEMVVTDKSEHCAGAMIMLEHMGRPNQMMRIAERLGFYEPTKLDMSAPVYRHGKNFVLAHKRRPR